MEESVSEVGTDSVEIGLFTGLVKCVHVNLHKKDMLNVLSPLTKLPEKPSEFDCLRLAKTDNEKLEGSLSNVKVKSVSREKTYGSVEDVSPDSSDVIPIIDKVVDDVSGWGPAGDVIHELSYLEVLSDGRSGVPVV
jgi:hypothetical protein